MARKTASRLQKRREVEAAAGLDTEAKTPRGKRKKAAAKPKKRASRSREKAPQRKRLIWTVVSGSMKEEARFPYDQRAAAEEKLEALRAKSKKLYFIQPVKEPITEALPVPEEAAVAEETAERDDEDARSEEE